MKRKSVLSMLVVMLLLATVAGCTSMRNQGDHTDLWGSPAPAEAATTTIVITPQTRFVNLIGGNIVRFVVGDKSFTWSFDGAYFPAAIDISKVSNGLLQRPFIAYVEANPMYQRDAD